MTRTIRLWASAAPPGSDRGAVGRIANVGTFVLLRDVDTGECESHELVDPIDASLSRGRLSVESNLGRALMHQRPGAVIELDTASVRRRWRLIEVETQFAW
jgi:transcription elongation GreA/GreB family factor